MAVTRVVGYGEERHAETLGVGTTLGTKVTSERVMSDIWEPVRHAFFLDLEAGAVRDLWSNVGVSFGLGANDYRPEPDGTVVVTDATPDVREEAVELEARKFVDRELSALARKTEEDVAKSKRVRHGDRVTVVRGRKVPKGTTGEVFWVGDGRWGWRVGFTPDGVENDGSNGTFTALSNVEVDPDAAAARVPERPFDAEAVYRKGRKWAEDWLAGLTATNDEVEATA